VSSNLTDSANGIRDIAQFGSALVWGQVVVGSNPAIPTKIKVVVINSRTKSATWGIETVESYFIPES
jgi:hypothetical protein